MQTPEQPLEVTESASTMPSELAEGLEQAPEPVHTPRLLYDWLKWWHGRGDVHQYEYYRCHGCRRIVTWHAIRKGGCTCGVSNRLSPARLRWYEKARLLVLPFWCVR